MGGLRAARAASPPPARAGRKGHAEPARRPASGWGRFAAFYRAPLLPAPGFVASALPPALPRPGHLARAPDRGGAEADARGGGRAVSALCSGPRGSRAPRAAPASPAAGRLSFWEWAGEAPPRAAALIGCRPEPPAPRAPLRTLIGESGEGACPTAQLVGEGKVGERSTGGAAAGARLSLSLILWVWNR